MWRCSLFIPRVMACCRSGLLRFSFMYCRISCRSCTCLSGSWYIRRDIKRKPYAPSLISFTTFHELRRGGFGELFGAGSAVKLVDAKFCRSGGLLGAGSVGGMVEAGFWGRVASAIAASTNGG